MSHQFGPRFLPSLGGSGDGLAVDVGIEQAAAGAGVIGAELTGIVEVDPLEDRLIEQPEAFDAEQRRLWEGLTMDTPLGQTAGTHRGPSQLTGIDQMW